MFKPLNQKILTGDPMVAALILATATGLSALSLWLYLDTAVIVTYASAITKFCYSLYVHCLPAYQFLKVGLFWLGGGLIAAGLVHAATRALLTLFKTRRALKRLPLKYSGGSVVLIDDTGLKTAFTHGLLRPRIYLSLGLLNDLSGPELRGVFLHELHHKRRRDPLKFFLLAIIKDFFFYLPAVAYAEKYLHWSKEHAADDDASSRMKEPLTLASALLKVVRSNSKTLSLTASITGANNSGSGTVLERIRRLTGGRAARFTPLRLSTAAVSLAVSTLLLFSLTLPLTTGPVKLNHCKTGECSLHRAPAANNCRVHCTGGKVAPGQRGV